MNSNFTIRVEEPRDFRTVENLTREAFWNVYRPRCTFAKYEAEFPYDESYHPKRVNGATTKPAHGKLMSG